MWPGFDVQLARFARALRGKRAVVVATSGGPDSQALLCFAAHAARAGLCELKGAIGIDHGLRPEAHHELALAHSLAARFAVPFVERRVDMTGCGNLLARARQARNAALQEEARGIGADVILLGHSQDDLAETQLWHLLRGSGPAALAAMPMQQGMFLRPLLDVPRAALRAALEGEGVAFACDPSNDDGRRMRARMRAHVFPALEAQFPGAKHHLTQGLAQGRAEHRFLGRLAQHFKGKATGHRGLALHVQTLRRAPKALWPRILRLFLLEHGGRPRVADLRALCRFVAAPPEAR